MNGDVKEKYMELYPPCAGNSDNSASFNQSIFYDGENRKGKKKNAQSTTQLSATFYVTFSFRTRQE